MYNSAKPEYRSVPTLPMICSSVVGTVPRIFSCQYAAIPLSQVVDRAEFEVDGKPLGKERFAGCIDTCGGKILANLLPHIKVTHLPSLIFKGTVS